MLVPDDREDALNAFDSAGAVFVAELSVDRTPAPALRYRPAGEDYALGGLIIHVAQVLEKYAGLLEAIRSADWEPVTEPAAPTAGEVDAALVRDGFDEEARVAVLGRVGTAHARLVGAVRAVPGDAFHRAAPVTYAGAAGPFETSPADVLGWVRDHYDEHVRQAADLRSAWETGASEPV